MTSVVEDDKITVSGVKRAEKFRDRTLDAVSVKFRYVLDAVAEKRHRFIFQVTGITLLRELIGAEIPSFRL